MTPAQIKDLLEEAGLVSYGEDTGFYNIPAPAFLSRIDRLAELIVKECVSLRTELTQFDSTDPYGDGYENGLKDMAELMVIMMQTVMPWFVVREILKSLPEHFGVKE
jgi:hypothetical protein